MGNGPHDEQPGRKELSKTRWSRRLSLAKNILDIVLAQWLVIGFGLSCLLAYFFPGNNHGASLPMHTPTDTWTVDVAAHGGIIRSEYSILYGGVSIIFLVSGLQLSHEKLRMNLTAWRLHVIVQGISFVLIPVIMLGLASHTTPCRRFI